MKKIFPIILSVSIAMLTSSCELIDMFNKGKSSTDTKISKDEYLPSDRETILTPSESATYSPAEISKGIVRGDWAIETVNGKKAVGETTPYLKFVPKEKKVYGDNGCNVLNGSYSYNPADSTISFSNMISTMRLCSTANITDIEINLALERVKYYTWGEKDSQYWLYLLDNQKTEVMSLMHQNFEFLNGTWRVAAVDDQKVDDPEIKLVIDIDEGKIHGYTGCNTINGTIEIDMDGVNSISFQAFTMTKMACGPDSVETPLLVALENGDHAKLVSPTTVYIIDARGEVVLVLERSK